MAIKLKVTQVKSGVGRSKSQNKTLEGSSARPHRTVILQGHDAVAEIRKVPLVPSRRRIELASPPGPAAPPLGSCPNCFRADSPAPRDFTMSPISLHAPHPNPGATRDKSARPRRAPARASLGKGVKGRRRPVHTALGSHRGGQVSMPRRIPKRGLQILSV